MQVQQVRIDPELMKRLLNQATDRTIEAVTPAVKTIVKDGVTYSITASGEVSATALKTGTVTSMPLAAPVLVRAIETSKEAMIAASVQSAGTKVDEITDKTAEATKAFLHKGTDYAVDSSFGRT